MLVPKQGTLERIVLKKLIERDGQAIDYTDFIGTGITEENLGQLVENLQTGMFEAEADKDLKVDG